MLIKRENIDYNFGEFTREDSSLDRYFLLKECKESYIVKVTPPLIVDWLNFSSENDLIILEQRDVLETFTSWCLASNIDPSNRNTKHDYEDYYIKDNKKASRDNIELIYKRYKYHYKNLLDFSFYMHENQKNINMKLRYLPQKTLLKYKFEYPGVEKIWKNLEHKFSYIEDKNLLLDYVEKIKLYHEKTTNALSLLDYDEIIE